MASVRLDFVPPNETGLVKLRIYESATREGSFNQIEEVTAIGSYPTYITEYTTNLAGDTDSWFAIDWVDSKGATTELSEPIQGGTTTVVGLVLERMLLRDPTLDERVALQIAELAVVRVMGVTDPYTVTPAEVTITQLEGMTLLGLAQSYISTIVTTSSSGEGYTAGLVAQKAESGSTSTKRQDLIKYLLDSANALLGLNFTYIMLLEDIDPVGMGIVSAINWDHSRLYLGIDLE